MMPNQYRFKRVQKFLLLAIFALLVLGMVIFHKQLNYALFGFKLPTPTGTFEVGRITLDAKDPIRPEIFTDDTTDHREIRIDVYYPATHTLTTTPGIYLHSDIVEGITGLPPIAVQPIIPNWRDHASPAPANAPYPVLLFSPGFDASPSLYTSLLEELTSRGHIIVALWHPYTTSRIRYTDGRIIESRYEANSAFFEGTEEERNTTKQRIATEWAKDMITALNEIEIQNKVDGPLKGYFDLNRIGAFGHSFGGQNAAAAMTLEPRIRAGLNMDGTTTYQPAIDNGVQGPFAFVYDTFGPPYDYLEQIGTSVEEWWKNWMIRNCPIAIRENAQKTYIFQIDQLAHEGFATDITLLQSVFPFVITPDMVGTINGNELLPLLADLIHGFFSHHLSDNPAPILENPEAHHPALHRGIRNHPDPQIAFQ